MVPNTFQRHGTTVVDCCSSLHTTRAGPLPIIGVYNPPGQTNTTLLTCLSMALCTYGSEPTIIAGDFQHQLHEHVGTQHPPAAHQPCCWAGGFHAQQRLCFAPFASHLGGGLLDHMWANLHHTWPPVKQIPFVEEAWFSDHLAVGCEHQPCRLL